MTPHAYHIKTDFYTAARGGTCGFLTVSCAACAADLLLYQKDLPYGPLLRMYADRIHAPADLVSALTQAIDQQIMQALTCPSCQAIIATPMIYQKKTAWPIRWPRMPERQRSVPR